MGNFKLFAGSSHPQLAQELAQQLSIGLSKIEKKHFPNGEMQIRILDEVGGQKVFILQALSNPASDYLVELCLLINAAKQGGAKKVIAIIPWLAYSGQDKVFLKGEPVSAQVTVEILESVGVDQFILLDLHSQKVADFFQKPIYHLSAAPVFINQFKKENLKDFVVVALDLGAKERSQEFANELSLPLVCFDKKRDPQSGEVEFINYGQKFDFKDKNIISFDDFVSTGATRIKAAEFLKSQGVAKYIDCVTHLFQVPATYDRLRDSVIDEIWTTNSLPILEDRKFPKLKVFSIASLLAEVIVEGI